MLNRIALVALAVFVGAIFVPLACWLIGAFVSLELNPFEWSRDGRISLVMVSLIFFWIPGVVAWNLSDD